MKIQFRAIGKNHDKHFAEAIQLFTKRIGHYYTVDWKIIAPSRLTKQAQACTAETRLLLQKEAGEIMVALDERGSEFTSAKMAAFIETQAVQSVRTLVFSIGGAYGFDQQLIRNADLVWSLSRLTFPHQLVRLILAEQIYRSCTINRGEKYHHE